MSSTKNCAQYSNQSAHLRPSDPEHFSDLSSPEKQAIAASVNKIDTSTYLSPLQQSAIGALHDFEDSKVLELLAITRLPDRFPYPYPEPLSNERVDALSQLKACPNNLVLLGLRRSRVANNHVRNPYISGPPAPPFAVANGSRSTLRRPLNTTLRPSSTVSGHPLAYSNEKPQVTTGFSLGQYRRPDNSSPQSFIQVASSSPITVQPPYACLDLSCKKHHDGFVFKTCDGWKRHVKEHGTVWPCMPNGRFDNMETGLACAFCDFLEPDKAHVAGHCIGDCGDTTDKLRSFTRRINLEKHLSQSHGIHPDRTRGLADKWKRTLRKKHFACGFCIGIFSTVHEQLNHVDIHHFRKGQQIQEWSATKVIRGLLLSPGVFYSFHSKLSANPYAIASDLYWDRLIVKDLQRRLETAEDTAETLATEAYNLLVISLSRRNPYGQQRSISHMGNSAGHGELAVDPFVVSGESLEKNGDPQIERYSQDSGVVWPSDGHLTAAPPTSFSMPDVALSANPGDRSEATTMEECQSDYCLPPGQVVTSTVSAARSEHPCFAPQTDLSSSFTESSFTSAYDSFDTASNWQAVPSTTSSSLHSTGAQNLQREQTNTYRKPAHELETRAMPVFGRGDFAGSPRLEEPSHFLNIQNGGHLQQWSSQDQLDTCYDINVEPEHVKKVMQIDGGYPMEPLTCDPKDLVK